MNRRVPARPAFALVCACAALAAALALAFVHTTPSSAICNHQDNSCLPQGNYTLDTTFNCGSIASNVQCYANGTTVIGNAVLHHYGFISSAYSGTGNVNVTAVGEQLGISYFGGSGTNLIRTCYHDDCTPQADHVVRAIVYQSSGASHTVNGHAEA